MDPIKTLEEASIVTLKPALATTTWAEVLLAEALSTTEVPLEEGHTRIQTLGEEEVTPRNSSTRIATQLTKATIVRLEQTKALPHIVNGTTIQMRICTTISRVLDLVIITTDNYQPFEKVSSRQPQTWKETCVHTTIIHPPRVRVC